MVGVPKSHPRTSLLVQMVVLSVGWEARIMCILFWHTVLVVIKLPFYARATGTGTGTGVARVQVRA